MTDVHNPSPAGSSGSALVQTILIVEDDDATRAGLATLLADAGYRAHAVDNVPAALQLLAELPPDLLLVDIRVRDFNGLQLVAMRPREMPAIVVSGYSDPMLRAEAERLGAAYMDKPVSASALLALVRAKLPSAPEPGHPRPRRWPRKMPGTPLLTRLDDTRARIVDVSYGGMRLELPASLPVGSTVRLTLPAEDLSVRVTVVWNRAADSATWVCGAAVSAQDQPAWWGLVDAIS